MTFKEKVNELLLVALEERPSVFLIDFTITDSNKIIVTLDGDNGISLQDCIEVSRGIEHNLDREENDFSLEVTSVGLSTPLKKVRQYRKNIGKKIIVKTATEKIEANLVDATDDFIVVEWLTREPKKIGKGKETVQKRKELSYSEIKETVVTVTF